MLLFVSDCFDQAISQFSLAVEAAIHTHHHQHKLLLHILTNLCNSGIHNVHLTEMVYGWCPLMCENYSSPEDQKNLFLALEIGFRHLGLQGHWMEAKLTHTDGHQKLVDIVFHSGESETIADFLCAWTLSSGSHQQHPSLQMCAEHLVGLCHLQSFSPRLRKLVIHSIGLIGYQGFEQVGIEEFIRLLDGLHVCTTDVTDVYSRDQWARLLLDAIQSSEGIQCVSHQYWELFVELVALQPQLLGDNICSPHIMTALEDANEWKKLECWMGVLWITLPLGDEMEEELKHVTLSLFHQQPNAIQKLERWVEQALEHIPTPWEHKCKSLQQICQQAHSVAAWQETQ